MPNRYYNHENPFMPGSIVRADEANQQLDLIEIGFDRLDVLADSIEQTVHTSIMGAVQPQIDSHKAQTDAEFATLKGMTEGELNAFRALLTALTNDVTDKLEHVITLPGGGTRTLEISSYVNGNQIPYINAQGDAALLNVPDVALPADWAKVYLGRQTQPPGTDHNGDPVREGAMFYNESNQRLEIYRNGAWVPGFISGSGVVFIGSIAPPNPQEGDLWFDTQTADLLLWYEDGTSDQWVVINSNYNALFGPGIGPIVKDGTVPMEAPLQLSNDRPGPQDAVSRSYVENLLRIYAGSGALVTPHITNGVDPRSAMPLDRLTGNIQSPYNVRLGGTMLFFGNFGALHADYMAPLAGIDVQPGDFVISNGREWNLVRASGLAAGAPAVTPPQPPQVGPPVTVAMQAPRTPLRGNLWFDLNVAELKVWDGAAWEPVVGRGLAQIPAEPHAPMDPMNGDMWLDTTDPHDFILKVYIGPPTNQWQFVTASGLAGGSGVGSGPGGVGTGFALPQGNLQGQVLQTGPAPRYTWRADEKIDEGRW